MAADRVITCTNQDGDTVTFTEKGFFPFLLVSAEGVYDSKYNVNLMENTTTDGAIFQGGNAPYRNIVLTVKDVSMTKSITESADVVITSAVIKGKTLEILQAVTPESSTGGADFVDHREILDKVFKKNELGRLTFKEDTQERVIDYYVEYVKSTGKHSSRYHTISLICPDPFFYDPYDIQVIIALVMADFQFIHEFNEEGEEFGHNLGVYENIYNESANDNIGLTINLRGDTDIINPKITRLDSGDFIQIGTTTSPYTLYAGDSLLITTGIGNKHIYEYHNGTKTEKNYMMADGSSFIQLMRGDNHISFDATEGKNGATLEISYRLQYARA